ncbi:MAG: nuclear transport factor 2 family protein [Bacteroidia bacterium]
MKTKHTRGLLFFFLMSVIVACNSKNADQPAAAVIDTAQVKQEIQAKEDEFAAVYNAREMKDIGYYADDATSFAQNSPALVGKPAIVEYLKANIDSASTGKKLSCKTNEVFVSNDGNQVVETGYYTMVDSAGSILNSGNYMTLFVKRDGKYYSLRDMSVTDMQDK